MNTLKERYLAAKRRLFRRYYGIKLNEPQVAAVCTERGPLLVLAGAGSGKTTVLVRRIVHLLRFGDAYESDFFPSHLDEAAVAYLEALASKEPLDVEELEGVLPCFASHPCPPYAMLAITFTNKAAGEIKERLAAALGDPSASAEVWAGTFHSICVRILRYNVLEAGYKSGFSIYDSDDQKRVVSDAMKALNMDDKFLPIKSVLNGISHAKNNLLSPDEFEDHGDFRLKQIGKVYREYQKRLEAANALDFDDIILKTVKLLENYPDIAERYQKKFRYVCIDEYQDTNYAQFRLSELLSAGQRNIMVVGDDDQSIYRFRGATVENILHFDKTYPDARVIKLEQNYRSTKTILEAANAVIAHNPDRHDKSLWCEGEIGERITVHKADTQNDEAIWIKDKILSLVSKKGCRYRDIAILYRLNEMSRSLEGAFAKSGIPYRILGGQRFYDRKEIRDMVAYLHVIANPDDNLRLLRIVNEPKRKIGDATLSAVAEIAAREEISYSRVLEKAADYPELQKAASRLLEFASLMKSLRAEECGASDLIRHVYEKSGYGEMLRAEGEVSKTRIDNIGELVSAAAEYEKRVEEPSLVGFLEEIALISDVDKYDENADAVVLMTIHSAKGLEFPTVFLPGMEEGVFPTSQVRDDPAELNEERRLAYVALTRAKEKIFITHTHERMMYGRTAYNPPSRFLREEIPEALLEKDEPKRAYTSTAYRPSGGGSFESRLSGEFLRRPAATAAPKRPPLGSFTRFTVGDRVAHTVFGKGEILSVKEMGGDLLYEVRFDSGATKKLMATYAKLQAAE